MGKEKDKPRKSLHVHAASATHIEIAPQKLVRENLPSLADEPNRPRQRLAADSFIRSLNIIELGARFEGGQLVGGTGRFLVGQETAAHKFDKTNVPGGKGHEAPGKVATREGTEESGRPIIPVKFLGTVDNGLWNAYASIGSADQLWTPNELTGLRFANLSEIEDIYMGGSLRDYRVLEAIYMYIDMRNDEDTEYLQRAEIRSLTEYAGRVASRAVGAELPEDMMPSLELVA